MLRFSQTQLNYQIGFPFHQFCITYVRYIYLVLINRRYMCSIPDQFYWHRIICILKKRVDIIWYYANRLDMELIMLKT